jgi:hypothetical protein
MASVGGAYALALLAIRALHESVSRSGKIKLGGDTTENEQAMLDQ